MAFRKINIFIMVLMKAKKPFFILLYISLCSVHALGQNQVIADSMEKIYLDNRYAPWDELRVIKEIAFNHPDPEKSLTYSKLLLSKALQQDSSIHIIGAYLQIGNALRLKGDLTTALDNYFEGAKIAREQEEYRHLGLINMSIAGVYSIMGNKKYTIQYYQDAIQMLKDIKDSLSYASAVENLGDEYNLNLGQPDSALILFRESGAIFRALDYEIGIAYNLGNVGLAYAQQGKNELAEDHMTRATEILTRLGDYYPICVYLTYMADIYMERGDSETALDYAHRSLELARQYRLKDQINDAFLKLSELYEQLGNTDEAFQYYKQHITYKDSVNNISSVQQMADIRTNFELSQKQLEVDLANQQQQNQKTIAIATSVALFLIGLLAFGLFRRNTYIQKTKKIIEEEKKRSESLLLNILPEETAQELKENGSVEAKRFESVTVLFTDFEGFTNYAEKLPPEKLVKSVDFYFSKFDEIIEKYGMEKIKTIGDAYMGAGGLHFDVADHALKMVHAAIDIMDFVNEAKAQATESTTRFDIRIGINTGPVVAGVVGTTKFSYDIWGDTVNVASRMESMSQKGKINISETTYALIKDYINCEYRGEIAVKNRGKMKMYFVKGLKEIPGQPLASLSGAH